MRLQDLPAILTRSKKRLGRGLGSGKGKTAARGQKGQKARGKVPASFSGGGLPLYKKLPLKRGWGNTKKTPKPVTVTFAQITEIKEPLTLKTLIKQGVLTEREAKRRGAKLIGTGELSKSVTVNMPASKRAVEKIVAAGGKVG